MNAIEILSKKAELSEKILRFIYPNASNVEIVKKSKIYMKRQLVDLKCQYSALVKSVNK